MPDQSQAFIETNAAALAGRLNSLAGRLENPEPILRLAQALIARSEAEVWQSEGASLGEHWARAAEPERKTDSRLLVATGRLRESLAGRGSPLQVRGTQLVVGTDVPYGAYHQYGTSRMPARPFLGVSPSLARDLLQLFQHAVDGGTE
jgi:phage gpG-like protein